MKELQIILTREQFREHVFNRDGNRCVICEDKNNLDPHHIIDRKCFNNGGYLLSNGITLCNMCHQKAETGIYTCEELRSKANITEIILPIGFDPLLSYDKWGEIIKEELIKYPRTSHLQGSGIDKDDLKETVSFEDIFGKNLIIESKIDGANTGVSFSSDCELLLQCRGHYLTGKGDWPEFNNFKVWANTWKDQIFDIISDRYIMYGEWMYAFHTVYYDLLPHFFMEFDIYDKKEKVFLSTENRKKILDKCEVKIESVKVLKHGTFNKKEDIISLIGISSFISENSIENLKKECDEKNLPQNEKDILLELNKSRLMEGLYIKWEEDGIVKGRYKYVRPEFVRAILAYDKHWTKRPTIPNKMRDNCSMFQLKEII